MTWRYSELQIGPIKNEHLEGESRSHLLFGCFRDCILSGKGDLPCFNAYRYCSYVRELRSELPNRRPSMVFHGHVVSAAPHGNRLFLLFRKQGRTIRSAGSCWASKEAAKEAYSSVRCQPRCSCEHWVRRSDDLSKMSSSERIVFKTRRRRRVELEPRTEWTAQPTLVASGL